MPHLIFICYRREDSFFYSDRLFQDLRRHLGEDQILMDRGIKPGRDYVKEILEAIPSSAVMLVVVGRMWLSATDRGGQRRLDDPFDFVRREIKTALEHGVTILPVVLEGAEMPRPSELPEPLEQFGRINAYRLSEWHWSREVEQLARELESLCNEPRSGPTEEDDQTPPPAPVPAAEDLHFITSDLPGVFLTSREPYGEAFVSVGSRVRPDTVVGLVEVFMDLFEVKAGIEGTVEKVYISNGQLIDAHQPLYGVKKEGAPPAPTLAAAPTYGESLHDEPTPDEPLHVITSPIVGTFYRSPSPTADPFVRVGSRVEPTTVVCVLEFMKLMNEVEAETTGVVEKVYVENGQPVEYGQPLFGVRKSSKV